MDAILAAAGVAAFSVLLGVILSSRRFWSSVGGFGKMPQLLPKGWLRRHFGERHPDCDD